MYKLYGSPGSGSASVEAALAAAGADYAIVTVRTADGMHLTEDYRAINPRQQVPALALPDGTIITEGVALMLHIADAFPPRALAPVPATPQRAQHDRWLIFMAVNMYEGELRKAYPDRYTDDPDGAKFVETNAASYVKRHYEILEAAAGGGDFFLGDDMSMVDLYLWMLCGWMDRGWLEACCPKVTAIADRVAARPLVAPIHAAHFG